jgi:hypothetical protein
MPRPRATWTCKFLYVSEKKTSMLEDGDPTELLARSRCRSAGWKHSCGHCDKDTAKAIVPVQPASFYWQGAEDLRKEFYGI